MIGVLNLETSNKEKLSAKAMENYMEIKESAKVPDNRKEITEITETELKELEKVAKQYGRDSWKYSAYLKKNFKHIGEEIPEDVPFSEYYDYILKNFRITKPMAEWTDVDYKIYNSQRARFNVLFHIKNSTWKEPYDDRQKRIIERVRNGTDYDILAGECPEWFQ